MRGIVTAVRRRLGFRAKVLELLAGIDLTTTGTAGSVITLQGKVNALVRAEAAQTDAIVAAIRHELDGYVPPDKLAAIDQIVRANIAKLKAAPTAAQPTTHK